MAQVELEDFLGTIRLSTQGYQPGVYYYPWNPIETGVNLRRSIDCQSLTNGLYFYRVVAGTDQRQGKFIVQH